MTAEQAQAKDAVTQLEERYRLEAASRAEVPAAGAPIARRLTCFQASLRRDTSQGSVLLACATVSVRRRSGSWWRSPSRRSSFFQDISLREFLHGHGVVPTDRAFELRRPSARGRNAQHDVVGVRGSDPVRAGRRHPNVGVRAALQPPLVKPALEALWIPTVVYGYFALTAPSCRFCRTSVSPSRVQRPGRRTGDGRDDPAHRCVAVRRRHDGRSGSCVREPAPRSSRSPPAWACWCYRESWHLSCSGSRGRGKP